MILSARLFPWRWRQAGRLRRARRRAWQEACGRRRLTYGDTFATLCLLSVIYYIASRRDGPRGDKVDTPVGHVTSGRPIDPGVVNRDRGIHADRALDRARPVDGAFNNSL